jgi:hypothetical protein
MNDFRTRIARVRMKDSGLVVHNFPEPFVEEVSPTFDSFLDRVDDIVQTMQEMTGYALIVIDEEKAHIFHRHAQELAPHYFFTMVKHITENLDRYGDASGDQEAT